MKLLKLALCGAAASLCMAGSALAEDKPTFAFNAGVTSDYIFRGTDQSLGPAAFGGIDMTYGPVYLGTWVSTVDFEGNTHNGNHTLAEVDIYGGVKPTIGPVTLDLGGIGYLYPKQPSGSHENYFEFKAGASVPAGPVALGAVVYYSPNFGFDTGHATYVEVNAAYTFSNKATLSGALGHQDLDVHKFGLNGYTTWNVGVTYPVTEHVSVDLRYIGTNSNAHDFFGEEKDYPFNAADRIVGTVKATW